MDLQTLVLRVLQENASRARTFKEVVSSVADMLEDDIRATLNDLTDKEQIQRKQGGRAHAWRYQAKRVRRRPKV